MASSSSIVSYGSRSSGLANNRKSNLQITFNMGEGFNCNNCKKTIKDYLCLCNGCGKCLHPECAGVKIRIRYSDRDGSKYIMLPALEDLPVSCPNCLSGSSRQEVFSSIASALGSCSITADEHMLFLIHKSASGHELIKKNYGGVYTCFGCKEKGFGPHHACRNEASESCRMIRFHEECKSLRLTMKHRFFNGLSFDFCSKPILFDCKRCKTEHSDTSCNACGMYAKGYFYRSQDDKCHLHPCCANLPHQIYCGDTAAAVAMKLQGKTTSKCFYCNKKTVNKGDRDTDQVWSYVSESDNFHLHVACIIDMLSDLQNGLAGDRRSCILASHKQIKQSGVTEVNLQIAARADIKKKWEQRFKTFMKYAKIALGAVISAFLGDPTTLVISLVVALVS